MSLISRNHFVCELGLWSGSSSCFIWVGGRGLTSCIKYFYLILTMTLLGYYPHFIYQETEAQINLSHIPSPNIPLSSSMLFLKDIFQSSLRCMAKLRGSKRDFPCTPPPQVHSLPVINIPTRSSTILPCFLKI